MRALCRLSPLRFRILSIEIAADRELTRTLALRVVVGYFGCILVLFNLQKGIGLFLEQGWNFWLRALAWYSGCGAPRALGHLVWAFVVVVYWLLLCPCP